VVYFFDAYGAGFFEFRGWRIWRRESISNAPFEHEWIIGSTFAKASNMLAQCGPQFDSDRSDLLVIFGGKNLLAQPTNSIFHTTHYLPLTRQAAPLQASQGSPVLAIQKGPYRYFR
jgi:hypothetical protein